MAEFSSVSLSKKRAAERIGSNKVSVGLAVGVIVAAVTFAGSPNALAVARSDSTAKGFSNLGAAIRHSLGTAPFANAQPDTSWTQDASFTSSDGTSGDNFGEAVAISGNGTMAVVGAPYHNSYQGAAYVFSDSGGTWSQVAELTASNGTSDAYFGVSVAVSSDGSTILVGASNQPLVDQPECANGEAYIFSNSGGTWSQKAELTAASNTPICANTFGGSVSLSSAGTTALIGADYSDIDSTDATGAAYVFTDSGGTWSQQAVLTASNAASGDEFGYSVALSGDASTAILGATGGATDGFPGAAYIFSNSGGTWSQKTELTVSSSYEFGWSVAISDNGSTAAVGEPLEGDDGQAYVFTNSGDTWSDTELTPSGSPESGGFGFSVAVSSDATTVLVGAYTASLDNSVGSVYQFSSSGSAWPQQAEFSSDQEATYLGRSISMSSDSTALVGAPGGQGDSSVGQAYVFSSAVAAPTIASFSPTSGPPGTKVTITGTNLSGAVSVTFNGASATIKKDTATKLKVKVPEGATTGKIKVTTSEGSVTSTTKFKVT